MGPGKVQWPNSESGREESNNDKTDWQALAVELAKKAKQNRDERDALKAENAALRERVEHWELFAAALVEKHEGEKITEELLLTVLAEVAPTAAGSQSGEGRE